MKTKYTAREYAEKMFLTHGPEAPVTWLTIGELVDLYDKLERNQNMLDQATTFDCPAVLVNEDREQDELERISEDERDHRETTRSIISTFYPF